MPPRSLPRSPVVSRRVLLGGSVGAALVGAAGCDTLDPTSADPTFTPTTTPRGGAATATPTEPADDPAADDDTALVAEVASAIALAHRTAKANARLHPQLAGALRPFERLHRTHGDELGGLPATDGRVAARGESRQQVLARIDRREAELQRVLVGAATAAGSGALARTFASMAAGVAQLRPTLDAAGSRA